MIKTLQRKFVITAMAAISLLILVLLGVINIVNAWSSYAQTEELLLLLSDNKLEPAPQELQPPDASEEWPSQALQLPQNQEPQELPGEGPRGFLNPPITEDTAMSAVYFTVWVDPEGEVAGCDVSRIASVTEDEAAEYALAAMNKGKTSGTYGHFKYLMVQHPESMGTSIIFLDTTSQVYFILRVLALSVLVGITCWLLMLLLVILLSKKAIFPIAKSFEKQKQFVTDAGHEIKNPLAIILANTEALELHQGESRWSRNIREQTLRLNDLMQNLLTLARMEEGQRKMTLSKFSADQLLTETLEAFTELAEKKGLHIQRDIQSGITLTADRDNVMRLFTLLIDNGVKYADEEGSIRVSLSLRDKEVVFEISNTCQEFPEAEPEQLFDRFYRGNTARTQQNGGYGLGLSAARAIAEAHHGMLKASYEGEMVVFTVRLPYRKSSRSQPTRYPDII